MGCRKLRLNVEIQRKRCIEEKSDDCHNMPPFTVTAVERLKI